MNRSDWVPERIQLFPSVPAPTTGAERECLSSKLRRTCEENGLPVSAVITDLLLPQLKPKPYAKKGKERNGFDPAAIDSGGEMSRQWARGVELLTGETSLERLTLVYINADTSFQRLVTHRRRRWCPACLDEDAQNRGPIYDRLLWQINAVEVCPRHSVLLELKCGRCGASQFRPATRTESSGCCPRCYSWLGGRGRSVQADRDDHANYMLWTAKSFSMLLDEPDLDLRDRPASLARTIEHIIEQHFEGNQAAFARAIERRKNVAGGWLKGTGHPSWAALCDISFVLHIPLRSMLEGSVSDVGFGIRRNLPTAIERLRRSPRKKPQPVDRKMIGRLLTEVIEGLHPSLLTVKAICDQVGLERSSMRKEFGALAAKTSAVLAERRRLRSEVARKARRELVVSLTKESVAALQARGESASRRQIAMELSKRGLDLRRPEHSLVVMIAGALNAVPQVASREDAYR